MHGNETHPIETLKLSDRDKARLIQAVEAQAAQQSPHIEQDRRNLRVSYAGKSVLVSLEGNGSHVRFSVVPRNISRGGMAFVHGRFVYPNTPCHAALPRTDGKPHQVEGKVVHCRHVAGIVHEVSVRFDAPINLEDFVVLDPEQADAHSRERCEWEADNPLSLDEAGPAGRVLVVDDFATDRKLIAHHLQQLRLVADDAAERAAAIKLAKHTDYGLMVVDLDLGRDDGLELIRQLRASGLTMPVVATSARGGDALLAQAMAAGGNALVTKPFAPHELCEKVAQLLSLEYGEDDGDALTSALADDREMRPLVREFVAGLAQSIATLREQADDTDALREVCQTLKGAGTSYGFEPITRTAALVLTRLDADQRQADDIAAGVQELIGLLRRVQFV